jgi:hypothetical protein
MSSELTRRRFLGLLGAGAACLTSTTTVGCDLLGSSRTPRASPLPTTKVWPLPDTPSAPAKPVRSFRSRPDLSPPAVEVNTRRAQDTAPGYIFVAPKKGAGQDGPMIIDESGNLVWFGKNRYATDFRVQIYKGVPVLTWWGGKVVGRHGEGEYVIFDSSYREVRRVRAGNGYEGDLHEFLITPEGTALLTAYAPVRTGLPSSNRVLDGIAQEVDIETGEVLFEWHSLDHVGVDESYVSPQSSPAYSYDYFHINSIDVDHDGNLLVSARNTWTVYKIDRKSGEVLWRLGGKKSDFEMGPGTRTAFQHDARRQEDGTITIFDNGAGPKVHYQSRAIVIELDTDSMSAALVRALTHPKKLLSTSQGNAQVLPNGNAFVGWGSAPFVSEFSHDGEPLFDASFPGRAQSYRAFRLSWNGYPADAPAIVVERRPDAKVALYVSWNGATDVESWEVLAGARSDSLQSLGSIPRDGFETGILAQTQGPYLAVRARGRSGRVLGASTLVEF